MAKKTKVKILKSFRQELLSGSHFEWEQKDQYGSFPHREEDFGKTAFVLEAIELNGKIFIDAEALFGKPRK